MARSVAAYVNNETYANFQYVDERIKSLKDIIFFSVGKAGINDDGRQVPMVIISEWLDRLCLDIYYRLKGEEFIGYSYADMCLLVEGLDGRWIANYEHLYQTIEDDILDPSFEAVIVSPEMQKVIDKVTAEGNQL